MPPLQLLRRSGPAACRLADYLSYVNATVRPAARRQGTSGNGPPQHIIDTPPPLCYCHCPQAAHAHAGLSGYGMPDLSLLPGPSGSTHSGGSAHYLGGLPHELIPGIMDPSVFMTAHQQAAFATQAMQQQHLQQQAQQGAGREESYLPVMWLALPRVIHGIAPGFLAPVSSAHSHTYQSDLVRIRCFTAPVGAPTCHVHSAPCPERLLRGLWQPEASALPPLTPRLRRRRQDAAAVDAGAALPLRIVHQRARRPGSRHP